MVAALHAPSAPYSKVTPGETRAVPIGATASHTSNAGLYCSTEVAVVVVVASHSVQLAV